MQVVPCWVAPWVEAVERPSLVDDGAEAADDALVHRVFRLLLSVAVAGEDSLMTALARLLVSLPEGAFHPRTHPCETAISVDSFVNAGSQQK